MNSSIPSSTLGAAIMATGLATLANPAAAKVTKRHGRACPGRARHRQDFENPGRRGSGRCMTQRLTHRSDAL